MLIWFPKTSTAVKEKPVDWTFMEESEKVLANIPDTWKDYPKTVLGKTSIIEMEFNEFKEAQTVKDKQHELIHLASACLNLWRTLEGIK